MKIYPNCPSCKGEGHYILAGKDWPCTWCKIEYQQEICDHEFKLDSQIPFQEKTHHFCGPFDDIEFCPKCGKVKRTIKNANHSET